MSRKLPFYIKKMSGEKVLFDVDKLVRSLEKAKVPNKEISGIIQKITEEKISTTKQIHAFVLKELNSINPTYAARYNLKAALLELGPTGYPFEKYVAKIFDAQNFRTYIDVTIVGECVSHQVDILLSKRDYQAMVECKFHNKQYYIADIKIPLYVWGRFHDIEQAEDLHEYKLNQVWIVTNTRFSTQSREYAQCKDIRLLDWSYPYESNLPKLIDKYKLFPITSLTILSKTDKRKLIKKGVVLCCDLKDNQIILEDIGLNKQHQKQVMQVVREISNFSVSHKK